MILSVIDFVGSFLVWIIEQVPKGVYWLLVDGNLFNAIGKWVWIIV